MEPLDLLAQRITRRQQILDQGCPLADLDEYNVLTLKMAESAPSLLRAIKDVIAFRDELAANEGPVAGVAHAFADEIARALKGQR